MTSVAVTWSSRRAKVSPARVVEDGDVEEVRLASERFEIAFPRRMVWSLKLLNLLPYALYFPLIARGTGGKRKG